MGTFAKTANVDYRLSFADQERQTFVFRLQQINGSCRFPLVPFSIYIYRNGSISIEIYISIYSFVYIYIYVYMLLFQTKNGKKYAFANGLNGLNLCRLLSKISDKLLNTKQERQKNYWSFCSTVLYPNFFGDNFSYCNWTLRSFSLVQH